MNDFVRVLFLTLALFCVTAPAQAAAKENLVLMPLRVAADEKDLRGVMEAALVNGLQQKYKVYSGEEVAQKAKVIFEKESSTKKICDETRCMQDIALAFNAELIATATVQKQNDGYFLALKIQNIMDNTVVQSESLPCEGCNVYAVVDKLKELVGTSYPASSSPSVTTPAPKIDNNSAEDQLWQAVSQSNAVEDYQVYLDTYPKGKFVALVKARLKKLQDEAAAANVQKEKQSWDDAQKQNSESAYSSFMQQYPSSSYVALAKVRLNKLKADAAIESQKAGGELGLVSIPGKSWKMMKHEVTFAQWDACVAAGGCNNYKPKDEGWGRANRPVINVSYDDIQSYIQWLNGKSAKKFRLPTEEEWEYAARGGTTTEYWWGNEIGSNNANCNGTGCGDSFHNTAPVGSFKANPYGVYDTAGNVWEWTESCWEGDCAMRVVRGGSWFSAPKTLRVSIRSGDIASTRLSDYGFRLVQDN